MVQTLKGSVTCEYLRGPAVGCGGQQWGHVAAWQPEPAECHSGHSARRTCCLSIMSTISAFSCSALRASTSCTAASDTARHQSMGTGWGMSKKEW